ncbi:hypothetical protein AMATHDRAFT_138478 [Amanita thiersii Skay4041]|uniref:Peptidase A1 domain-containing protein n=1 Tax=Amanita thiersii Skay4041 TaxID=703135 RepID=A0A2A9NYM2_9AGAR|nr:hypothetical protein AMATHDRAFT_138478 [Amanita thiersii Skay4041]
MQFKTSFAVLLASILFAAPQLGVEAAPNPTRRSTGAITLPLRRVERSKADIHPLINLQQNINRGNRRLARMSGRELPSDEELADKLWRRIVAIEDAERLSKRYSRYGVPKTSKGKGATLKGNKANALEGHKQKQQGQNSTATAHGAGNGTTAADTPDGVTAANQPSTPNSLGLDIEGHDVSYLSTIQIGNPPRDFILLMDSGSADMWVGSENCQSEAGGGCGNHNFLGPNSSNSFKTGQQSFQVTYGTGAVAGTVVQDDVSIAGLALPGHTFGVADQESVDFSDDSVPFDGIMGLAKSTLSEEQTLTPIEALAKAGLVPAAITSFKIPRLDDGKNDGEVTFGALDTTKFDQQTLVTVDNVNPDGFWEANMDAIKVDGQDTSLQGRTAILDTGTTLIIAPEQDAVAVHQLIQGSQSDGQGGFTVPCTTNASITLSFGGTEFAIDPRDIAFQPLDPRNPSGDCVSGIAGGNIGGANEWLVGDVFLKNAYFSTDVGKNTLSLAKLV